MVRGHATVLEELAREVSGEGSDTGLSAENESTGFVNV